jgi:carboxymethylenebutenolidase
MSQRESQAPMPSSANTYLAKPESGKGRRVLVLHAWWGLNEFSKELCDRLAQEGFVALAPDLYHGAVASSIEQAKKLSSTLKPDVVAQQITHAAEQLQGIGGTSARGIGVIGFSLGGSWALWLASQKPSPVDATVVFYATGEEDFAQGHSAFQFHHAENDDYEPTSEVEKLQNLLGAAGRPAEFYVYPGATHWFFESDRPDAYQTEAAQLAWNRTVEFLRAHLKET